MPPFRSGGGLLALALILFLCACQAGAPASPPPAPTASPRPPAAPLKLSTLPPPSTISTAQKTPTLAPSRTSPPGTRTVSKSALGPADLGRLAEISRLGKGTILNMAFSPDGRYLAFATRRGIALHDPQTYREIRTVEIEEGVPLVAFSEDGQTLAAAGWDSKIRLLRTSDLSLVRILDGGDIGQPLSLVFFKDGKTLCLGTTGDLTLLWDLETGKLAKRWYTTGSNAMADSSDGLFIATSNWEGSVYFWLASNGKSQGRVWRDSAVLSVQFSPDSSLLAAGYVDGAVALWNAMDGKLRRGLKGHTQRITSLAFSPDNRLAASASWDGTVCLWDVQSGEKAAVLDGGGGRMKQALFSADGGSVLSLADDGIVRIWSTTGRLLKSLADFVPLGHAVFSPDGQLLATGVEDGTWRLWRVSDGELVRSQAAHPGGISALRFSVDGALLITGGLDKIIRVWQVADGSLKVELEGSEGWINGLALSPDGAWVGASTTSGVVRVWELNSGLLQAEIEAGSDTILNLAFSPAGDSIFTGGMDGGLKSYLVKSGARLATLIDSGPFLSSVNVSPDGRWLAAGGDDRRIPVWELTGQTERLIDGLKSFGVVCQTFGPRSDLLLAAFWDRTLRAYAIPNGDLLKSWSFPFNVHSIDISPDGTLLALSLEDGTVRIWGIK